MAYDDLEKSKDRGIYRVQYEDKNDLNKKGEPKIKFRYYFIKDDKEVDIETLDRINKLGLAPAYKDVWISEDPDSKIQATGMDAKDRKQYRYHPRAIEIACENKFLRLYKFIKAMPKLDEKIEEDIIATPFSKDRTIAYMLLIVKETNMRVGKEHYAQTNKSYGISSMKKSHLSFIKGKDEGDDYARLSFKGKSNKHVSYTLKDKIIVEELKQLSNLDGEKLFQYVSNDNKIFRVTDTDINQYIQNYMGKEFTIKDFRTNASNLHFVTALLAITKKRLPKDKKTIKKNLNEAQDHTAFHLRHTKSISKKSYTMGLIRDMYENTPQYFVENKGRKPINVLIDLLKIYKDKILEKRAKEKETMDVNDVSSDEDEEDIEDEDEDE